VKRANISAPDLHGVMPRWNIIRLRLCGGPRIEAADTVDGRRAIGSAA